MDFESKIDAYGLDIGCFFVLFLCWLLFLLWVVVGSTGRFGSFRLVDYVVMFLVIAPGDCWWLYIVLVVVGGLWLLFLMFVSVILFFVVLVCEVGRWVVVVVPVCQLPAIDRK